MKKIIAIVGLFFAAMTASAQASLDQGSLQLNAGVGLSSWGTPVYVGLDYGATDDISVGAEVSYRSKKETYYGYSWKHTVIGVLVNGNYHFNRVLSLPSEFDLYAGLSVGYYNWTHKYDGPGGGYSYSGDYSSGLGVYAQIGGRYFFTDVFGVNLELGAGQLSGGKIGITYKF